MSAGKSKLVLFDLDHTLLDGDSDVLWCQFLMDAGVLDATTFGPRNAAMASAYKAGTVSVREFCEFYVGTLAGRSAAQWQALLQRFVKEVVSPRISPAAHALVQEQLYAGALVVLTTATNRFITEPTTRLLGIEHLAEHARRQGGAPARLARHLGSKPVVGPAQRRPTPKVS
jgi:phosphoserine phosphatase